MKKFIKALSLILAVIIISAFSFSCNGKNPGGTSEVPGAGAGNNTGFSDKYFAHLVKNDKSDYTILIPDEPTAVDGQASYELADFVYKSTGVQLQTVSDRDYSANKRYISIGRTTLLQQANLGTDYSELNEDGFVIKTVGKNVIIDAGTNRGFLYGTYEFIEKVVGVRFFASDETYVPIRKEIVMNEMDVLSAPAFRMRVYLSADVYPMFMDMEYIAHSRTVHDWINIPEEYGGSAFVNFRGNSTHNARFYVPAEKYGDASIGYSGEYLSEAEGYDPHPELWYILPGAKPQYEAGGEGSGITLNWLNGIAEDGSLDESMEVSTAKVVIEEIKKDLIANPEAKFVVLDQEDIGTIVPPDHPTVQKYGAAGVLVRFCNVVATEIKKWAEAEQNGREVNIVTFAYQQTQAAPVVMSNGEYKPIDNTVVPVDNLYIRLAYTSAMYFPYDDERQPEEVKTTLEKWSAICSNFWFWGYDAVYNDYMTYSPSLGQASGTVKCMEEAGVDFMLMQSTYNTTGDWQATLKNYVWSKLMWDSSLSVAYLVEEYLQGYYGPAAGCVRDFMRLYDSFTAEYMLREEGPEIWYWPYGNVFKVGDYGTKLTVNVVEKGIDIIEEGISSVEADKTLSEEYRNKLLKRLGQVEYTAKWMKLSNFDALYPYADLKEKTDLAQELLLLSRYSEIRMVNESTGIDWYLSSNYGVS